METNIADLKACRLCIETNCNLFDINANKLTNVLDEFTSSTASEMTGLPPYVCLNCFTMLLKATTFRDRCIEIQNYLYECSLIEPLTMDTIQNIDKSKMKNQCNVISEVIIINSIDDDTETVDTKQDVIEIDDSVNNDNDIDGFNEDSSNDYPSSSAIQIEDDIRPVSPNQDDDKDLRQLCAGFNLELIVLSVEEQMEELMARKEKFDDYPYKCEMCFLGYRSERAYRSHLSWHDPSMGPHACDICQRRFSKRRKLNMHLMAHKRKFRCKTCNKRFTGLTEARMHSESHDGRRFDCEHCGKMFTRYRSRLEHIRIHHGAACCDLCYKVYTNTYAVNTHKSRMHREVYTCDLCNTNFNKMTALNRHLDSLNGAPCDTVTPCCACGVNLQNDSALQNHIMSAHRDIRPAPGDKKRKKRCCPCGHKDSDEDTPQYPQDHDYHDLSQNITKIKCDCSCRVRYERNMERRRSRRYMCEVCASDFQSAAALRNHQRTHTGEKPYQCEVCPKRFRSNALLKMHVYTHTGERPYKCPFCPKAFGTPANNVRHQLVHTKERPHRCDICDKTFQTSDAVKLHVRTVHMKIPMPPRVRNRKKIVKEQ